MGSEFVAFNGGVPPPKNMTTPYENLRVELANIRYDGLFSMAKLRQLTVILPAVSGKDAFCRHMTPPPGQSLAKRASVTAGLGCESLVRTYVNKKAIFSKAMNSYVLDFGDRVKEKSVKNFQLVAADDSTEMIMQFGKRDRSKFCIDFRYPLSPYQAFAIAVSSLDYKICSE